MKVDIQLIREKAGVLFTKLNLVKVICSHIFGQNHSQFHRFTVGGIVFLSGFLLSEMQVEPHLALLFCKFVGFIAHGIGIHPFVDSMKT